MATEGAGIVSFRQNGVVTGFFMADAILPKGHEQVKELDKIYAGKNYKLWELDPDPGRNFGVSTLSITYGIVPKGIKQMYPANGKPEPLIEGKFYKVSAPSNGANFKTRYFTIKNNEAVMVTHEELVIHFSELS